MDEYYLEVVKEGTKPPWPKPESSLVIGSQPLSSGFVQFWAYPKTANKSVDDLPPAEELAQSQRVHEPVILIDQPEAGKLELVLMKDSHAWARTETNIVNLEANLTSLYKFGEDKFNIKAEHFMTTDRVSPVVESKLDELANTENSLSGSNEKEEGVGSPDDENDNGTIDSSMDEDKVKMAADTKEDGAPEKGLDRAVLPPVESAERAAEAPTESAVFKSDEGELVEDKPHEPVKTNLKDLAEEDIQFEPEPLAATPKTAVEEAVADEPDNDRYKIRPLSSSGGFAATGISMSTMPGKNKQQGGGMGKLGSFLPIIIVVGVFGFLIMNRDQIVGKVKNQIAPEPTPTVMPTPTPTPTPVPFERSKFTVRVLNGTVTSGLAGKLGDSLKSAGWDVTKTGNAKNQSTAQSQINVKTGADPLMVEKIQEDLRGQYDATTSSTLKDTETVDIEVVIGKK